MVPIAFDSMSASEVRADDLEPKSSASPLPKVQTFNAEATTTDEVVAALRKAGGCIVRGLIPLDDIRQIERDVRPFIEADKPWIGKFLGLTMFNWKFLLISRHIGDFFPPETRRVCGLVGKSPTFARNVVGNKLWLSACDALLTSHVYNWVRNSAVKVSNIINVSLGWRNERVFHFSAAAEQHNHIQHRTRSQRPSSTP